ncbi:MAG: ribose-5-phosphate isomerase RpiA [Henriciella sp.]|jgi:ribose 5-phosphate isomerase A|nr:ribose-5-phosphate isomerase RpiA [Henriciella sp.]
MANEIEKENAAAAAMDYVEDGMTIGLGTGSTAKFFVEYLAEEIADGLVVRGVPTSEQTRRLADSLGVPLVDVEQVDRIHLTVDGADEVDQQAQLIKGGGAALLREKIIANASDLMVVIADSSKSVETLGKFPLPVEVTPFGYTITAKKVYDALCKAGVLKPMIKVRTGPGHKPIVTDGGNFILDCQCGIIPDAPMTAALLSNVPGVVEHGLFIDIARTVIVGSEDGATVFEY